MSGRDTSDGNTGPSDASHDTNVAHVHLLLPAAWVSGVTTPGTRCRLGSIDRPADDIDLWAAGHTVNFGDRTSLAAERCALSHSRL